MLTRISILLFIFLILASSSYAESISVVEVVDGDTLLVNIDGVDEYIGIFGIDAPEVGQPFFEKSKSFVDVHL